MTLMRESIAGAVMVLWAALSPAQPAGITGVVVDARTGRPLPGAVVTLENQPGAVNTDAEGRFRLDAPAGRQVVVVTLVGYAVARVPAEAAGADALTIRLSEGPGPYEEHVTVSGASASDADTVVAGAALHGRELQALRGVTLDDPIRAVQALPSASANDDFYSEFAVRGSPFRQVGLAVDGMPSRYLTHTVQGVSDSGSIAMINSDAVASMALLPGSYPQRLGRHLGAQVDLTTREGSRDEVRVRGGLSGTSAAVLAEGPLGDHRGSWLVSARRSYLDYLLDRIDEEGIGFAFTDAQAKLVFDLTPRHQVQWLTLLGRTAFDEDPQELGANDEAEANSRLWLSGLAWRYTPSARFAITNRVYTTGVTFTNQNPGGEVLDEGRSVDAGWRADVSMSVRPGLLLEGGADALGLSGRHTRRRSLNDAPEVTVVDDYSTSGRTGSAYVQAVLGPTSSLRVSPGARIDYWGPTGTRTASPWLTGEWSLNSRTKLLAGAGRYQQFADLEQIDGVRGGGDSLRPEVARHLDVGLWRALPLDATLQVTGFARDEEDVLWTPGSEPRRLADGSIQRGRGNAPWANTLDGRARGVEVVLRRDAPAGLSGWAGYAYGRHRYTDAVTGEAFWADYDQRHSLALFGYYRLSSRATVGAKFRYGSNYPLTGYLGEAAAGSGPPLFGGGPPLFYTLSESRNTLRLPAYARLDLRADRAFTVAGSRMTLFVEVANVLNRRNVRNVPYGVDPAGRVFGPTDSMMPIVPSAGFVVEFQ